MKLTKLVLRNFKGIKSFTFEPGGESVDVFGRNESGKTTLFDGLTWLLTGKDSRDRSADNFGIKTRDDSGNVIHDIEHEVEGHFVINGKEKVLRRTYKENWVRKRGSSTTEFSGHTTDYHVDGVPVKAGEYQDEVSDIIDEKLLKMLTMPDYFPEQMHWTDRREVLFDLVGEIKSEDVIANYTGLDRYPEVIGDRTHEQQEKVLKSRKRDLNKELDNIPDRIDEVNRMIEDVEGVDEAHDTIAGLKEKKDKIEGKRSEIKSGGVIADLNVRKQELEAEKREAENKHQQRIQESLGGQRQKVSDLQDTVDEIESEFRQAQREYHQAESKVDQLESVKENVEQELQDIKGREPKPANAFEPEKCPVCEQMMPDADEHDYEAYLQEFNAEKAKEIKETKDELGQVEQDLAEAKELFKNAENNAANIQGKMNQRQQALEKAQATLQEQKQNQPEFHGSQEYEAITDQIDEIDAKIVDHRNEKQQQLDQLDELIAGIDSEINEAQKVIHQAEQNGKYNKRIAELQKQRKEVSTELEQVEEDIFLMEEYVRARSAYVTDKVNEKFELVSWKLFDEQINGGLQETCTAVFKGVPFDEGLNNAGRIQAGLDIINTLSKHYEKSAPVFVDNAESVSTLPDTDLQVIRLIVSPDYKKLTVEQKKELAIA